MSQLDYESTGVNVERGDEASNILFEAAKLTWSNRSGRIGDIETVQDHFRTNRFFQVPLPQQDGLCFGMNFDGIGTKVELAERMQVYRGLARDLFAMVCDDAACGGAEPILFGSILDMARVDLAVVKEVADGMVDAARIARVAVINGELAELPGRISGLGTSPLNWGAACLWVAKLQRFRNREKPSTGDVLIGVEERGFRSNGFSLLRAIFCELTDRHGERIGTDQKRI